MLFVVNSSSVVSRIKHGTAKPGAAGVRTNPLLRLSSVQGNRDARFLQQAFGKSNFIKNDLVFGILTFLKYRLHHGESQIPTVPFPLGTGRLNVLPAGR